MKRTIFQSLLKRFALLALATGTLFATSLTLSSCGGGGNDESAGTITYTQFVGGSKQIYLQAGSGMMLRCDPDSVNSGTEVWGYFYPTTSGLATPTDSKFHASVQGIAMHKKDDSPIQGKIIIHIGYAGNSYSSDSGFTSFLGFASNISPQLQLAAPLELTLDFDTRTWKTKIPDGSSLNYVLNASVLTFVFGEAGGSMSSSTTVIDQERSGNFDIMQF